MAAYQTEEDCLQNILSVHHASGDAICSPEDSVVVFPEEALDLSRRVRHRSQVRGYSWHGFLLHVVSIYKTLLRGNY